MKTQSFTEYHKKDPVNEKEKDPITEKPKENTIIENAKEDPLTDDPRDFQDPQRLLQRTLFGFCVIVYDRVGDEERL